MIVNNKSNIYDFLKENLDSKSKNNIKSLLHNKLVYVNNKCVSKYDYLVDKGDIVEIKKSSELDIIFEDKDIIVINKKAGLLTVSTLNEKSKTLYNEVSKYVKSKNKNNKIFIINRIDRDTSGIVMFAKSEKVKKMYQDNWNNIVEKRGYFAIVEGILPKKSGVIKSFLKEESNTFVHSTNKNDGKLAITEYKVIKEKNNLSLLDINIKTGRKNQIRVHMSENKTPILGDTKYSNSKEKKKRMYLHAYKLVLTNPMTNKKMEFVTSIPNEFSLD